MTIKALVKVERAERFDIDAPGTVRKAAELPRNVVIVNLSISGCLFRDCAPIEEGTSISIGIPGVGSRMAVVSRVGPDGCGCAFTMPLSAREVERAREAVSSGDADPAGAIRRLREIKGQEMDAAAATGDAPSLLGRLRRLLPRG